MKRKLFFTIPSLLVLCPCSINMASCHNKEISYKTMEVVTFQPFFDQTIAEPTIPGWEIPEGFDKYRDLLKGAGDYLKNHINTIDYDQDDYSINKRITSDLISKLGKNQIIVFEGHGSFTQISDQDPKSYSVMWTGPYWGQEPVKQEDIDELRIVNAEGNEAISLHFIEEYCGDLSGSIVYLGNCYSGRDVTFAQAFLNKGAEAVIGNSDTIRVAYNNLIEYTTIKKLGEINKKTDLPYTLYEALEYAKSIYGKNDKEKDEWAAGAEPLLFGNGNFRLSK